MEKKTTSTREKKTTSKKVVSKKKQVVMPQHGLFIKAGTLVNGKVRTSKVLMR